MVFFDGVAVAAALEIFVGEILDGLVVDEAVRGLVVIVVVVLVQTTAGLFAP